MRLAAALSIVAFTALEAQETAGTAAARLRSLYLQQAYVDGWTEGSELVKRFPRSPEVRAWYVINYSTSGFSDQAIDSARVLVRQFPRSPWSSMALAFALSRNIDRDKETVPMARRANALAPNDFHLALLTAQVMERMGMHSEALAFIDTVSKRFPPSAQLLATKGSLLRWYSRQRDADTAAMTRAREAFAEARRLEANNANVLYLSATSIPAPRGDTTSFVMLKRASELSPFSTAIHNSYWAAIQGRRDIPDSVKRAMGVADVERFLAGRPNQPAFMYVGAGGYATFGVRDKQREIHERLLRDYSDSRYAYLVRYDWLNAYGRDSIRTLWDTTVTRRATREDSTRLRAEYRRLLNEFIALSYHYSSSSLGSAYLSLFSELRGDSLNVSNDELLAAIKGMVKYNTFNPNWTHYDVPILLAERKLELAYATQLANESSARFNVQLEGRRSYATAGEIAESIDFYTAQKHDALGWIAFHSGRLDDAERELNAARELAPRGATVYYHLGRVAEAQNRVAAAEQLYGKGYQYETSGFFGGKQNANALKRIYEARTGSLANFDSYVEKLKEEDRARRKEKIANAIIKDRQDVPAFSLEMLVLESAISGPRITKEALNGKIGVVNFWGVWCGPCVAEMPQLQRFHDQVKNDTSVVFLTVDYRDEVKIVRDWMNQKKFTMPVLLDDGWVTEKARISAYPTTWFIDKDGKIAFIHKGASDVVLEEFLWRVEMLKGGVRAPGSAVP
ncbi:MAG: redoxin domain-containing protein [Gemmatimonadaceae bacterium]